MHYRSDNHGHKGLSLILLVAREALSGFASDAELNPELFQGDIVNPPVRRNGIADPTFHWPNAKVYYYIDRKVFDDNHARQIVAAMSVIESYSCVRFIHTRMEYGSRALLITGRKKGCASAYIGYKGKNKLMLEPSEIDTGCFSIGSLIHELFHVLGFEHQHVAHNRDEYVRIMWQNIKDGHKQNFWNNDKSTKWHSYGEKYDYGSIMHYHARAYSKNGKETIVGLREGYEIMGTRRELSWPDIRKLNRMYKCKGYV